MAPGKALWRYAWSYAQHPDVKSSDAFLHARALIEQINGRISPELNNEQRASEDDLVVFYDFFYKSLAQVIYGSNMQEDAGLAFNETHLLLRAIIFDQRIDPTTFRSSEEYRTQLASLIEARGLTRRPSRAAIVQARREVIQHAHAFVHMFTNWVNKPCDEPLTEDLIKSTHALLCEDLPADLPTSSRSTRNTATTTTYTTQTTGWAGIYRTHTVRAGYTYFTPAPLVPAQMAKFITDFNADISHRVNESLQMDPFYLAADMAQDFVLIHPFADGNGRMSRLLLNAVLIKFAGCMCPLGMTVQDRKTYLDVVKIAAEDIEEGKGDEYHEMTPLREEEARCKLAGLVLDGAVGCLEDLKKSIVKVSDSQDPGCRLPRRRRLSSSSEEDDAADERAAIIRSSIHTSVDRVGLADGQC